MKAILFGMLVGVVVLFIIVGPFITIWAVNTLFGLSIGYTLSTWFAVIWLNAVTFGSVSLATRG